MQEAISSRTALSHKTQDFKISCEQIMSRLVVWADCVVVCVGA